MSTLRKTWTAADLNTLGVTVDIVTAGEILGIGRTKAYSLARAGQFPVPVLRIAGRYRVPTAGLVRLLHLGEQPGTVA
jgi:hypothetical protein